jgi:phosphatidylglycerophosphate synthase
VIVVLALGGMIAWWQIALVLSRDLVVGLAALYFAGRRRWDAFRQMPSRPAGKVATACVFAWFVTLTAPGASALQLPVFVLTAAACLVAAGDYVVKFGRALAEHPA